MFEKFSWPFQKTCAEIIAKTVLAAGRQVAARMDPVTSPIVVIPRPRRLCTLLNPNAFRTEPFHQTEMHRPGLFAIIFAEHTAHQLPFPGESRLGCDARDSV
jgi:hypothetical protein